MGEQSAQEELTVENEQSPEEQEKNIDVSEPKEEEKKGSGPPEGSARWEEIYWKAKEGERAREELQELKEAFKAAGSHNKALEERISKMETKVVHSSVDSEIAELNREKKKALDDADFDRYDQIRDKIDDLKLAKMAEKFNKPSGDNGKKPEAQTQDIDDRIAAQVAEQKFYSDNPDLVDTAWKKQAILAIYDDMAKDSKFKTLSMQGRMSELAKRARKEFKVEAKSPTYQFVEPASGSPPPAKNANVVKLNAEERKIARNMFPDDPNAEKRYARQKAMIGRS